MGAPCRRGFHSGQPIILCCNFAYHIRLDVKEVVSVILKQCLKAAHLFRAGLKKAAELILPFLT
jgi:hypothetical protein